MVCTVVTNTIPFEVIVIGASVVVSVWISAAKAIPSDTGVTVEAGRVGVCVMNTVLLIVAVNVTGRHINIHLYLIEMDFNLPGAGVAVVVIVCVKKRVLFCVTVSGAKVLVTTAALSTV